MKLTSVIFYTKNIEAVKDFYLTVFKLKIDIDTPNYISFDLGNGITLGIKLSSEPREIPGSQTMYLTVEDVEESFDKFKSLNCKFAKELTKETWAYEFAIYDPDKNKIIIKQS